MFDNGQRSLGSLEAAQQRQHPSCATLQKFEAWTDLQAESSTLNPLVVGSNPTGPTKHSLNAPVGP